MSVSLNSSQSASTATIIIRQGDDAYELSLNFIKKYNIPMDQLSQLQDKIQSSINEALSSVR